MSVDRRLALLLVTLTLTPVAAHATATIVINNVDGAGVGFNDPTPVTPLPDNPGATRGAQRLNVFQRAAAIHGAILQSDVTIIVQATFNPSPALACTPTAATLGSAGTIQIFRDFPNAPLGGTWYSAALTNALAGADQSPGPPDPTITGTNDDIRARFNPLLDSDPTCLGGAGWYYGLDHNEGTKVDLLAVVLHEISHGLGFQTFTSTSTGAFNSGFPDVYAGHIRDLEAAPGAQLWTEMASNAARQASAINDPDVVWDGAAVNAAFPRTLGPSQILTINSPGGIAGNYQAVPASFGPPVPLGGLTGDVVLATDGVAAADVNDACEPLTNAAAINGNIALVHRGTCNFVIKAANVQAAGAIGMIVSNNVATGFPGMGGSDPSIIIPSIGVLQSTGTSIEANFPVNASLAYDSVNLAGARGGFVRLNAPNPLVTGSSISHWTPDTSPNLVMEPAINSSLTDDMDLTTQLFRDIGWFIVPLYSDSFETGTTTRWHVVSP
jgi:hypothetical protein